MHHHRTPSPAKRALRLTVIVALGLLLSACGGGKDKVKAKEEEKPVEDRFGFDQAGILQRQNKVEGLVRDCMKDKGFDYTPVDPAAQRAALVGSATLSEEDFEKQFGYGITTLYEQRRREAASGPNADYRSSLAVPQRAAYDRALYGKNVGSSFAVAVDSGDFADLGGCTKQATDQVFGGAEILTTLQTKLDELDARIESDPRMVAANRAWSSCMRTAGYPNLPKTDEVDSVLRDKLENIVGPTVNFGVGGPATERKYDKAALATLQRLEVAMVKADLACAEKHIAPVEDPVRKEFERTFAEQNAAFLATVPRA